jgi:hypothetical protein
MRRIWLAALLALAGCANVNGPFAARPPQRVDDPCYTIPEQEARGRDRLALPMQAPEVMPPSYVPHNALDTPGPLGRAPY